MSHRTSRRRFLLASAACAAGPFVIRSSALGAADGTPAPSNRINMGMIGLGKQGCYHLGALARRADIQLLAISEVQEERRQLTREILEKAAGQPGKPSTLSLEAVKYHNDFRDLLARRDIDAVLIATPDHWHAIQSIAAVKSGKDVFCEKPLTLTIREGREVVDAVKRYGRVFQTGSMQRSSWEFRFACEMVRSGRIGRLKAINVNVGGPSRDCDLPAEPVREGVDWEMWLGPAPYRPFNAILCPPRSQDIFPHWRSYRDYSGGGMTDWGAHHFDIAQWGMGTDDTGPVELIPPDGKDIKHLTLKYASGVPVYHNGGGNGVLFIGEKGTVEVNRGYLRTSPERLMQIPTRPDEVHLYKSSNHHDDFLNCVRNRTQPICQAEIGHRTVTVCHLCNICYWLNRPLKWDPAKEQFVGDEEANRWLDRPKRAPWVL